MNLSSNHDLFELFPASPASESDPWASFLNSLPRGHSKETAAVQHAMWAAFSAWCGRQELGLATIATGDIEKYLRSREGTAQASELTPRYTWRLVTLIGRVVNHMAAAQGRAPNRAATRLLDSSPVLRHANAGKKDPVPEVLSDSEDRTLVSFLESSRPTDSAGSFTRDGLWQVIRNRTGVALQRGAGLTPLEIRELTLNSVFIDPGPAKGPWKVRAPATGSVQSHDAPVASWARPMLTFWMQLRNELGFPGDWLLPSTKSGKQWQKTAHFESVADVLDSAGLKGFKGGSYLLRHTFAMRQLARPQNTEAMVAAWMGIDEGEMKRYRSVIMAPVDVV